jgi:CRP-like cAMP-binding protein
VAEPVFTISRGKVSRTLLKHYVETALPPAESRHLVLEDFEGAGIRVADRRFANRDMIFAPGDPDDQVYFLLEGTVRLYKIYGDYKEATLALLREGDVFGELGLEETSCQNSFAEAVTDARVALKLISSFSERLRQSEAAIESVLYREVSTRLATLLSHLADRFGEPHGSGTLIRVRLTHQELANMIFSTREAVSKVMSEFQRAGLIEIRNRRIVVNRQLETLS